MSSRVKIITGAVVWLILSIALAAHRSRVMQAASHRPVRSGDIIP